MDSLSNWEIYRVLADFFKKFDADDKPFTLAENTDTHLVEDTPFDVEDCIAIGELWTDYIRWLWNDETNSISDAQVETALLNVFKYLGYNLEGKEVRIQECLDKCYVPYPGIDFVEVE